MRIASLQLLAGFLSAGMAATWAGPLHASTLPVTITGEVEYNQVQQGPFAAVAAGNQMSITFRLSPEQFLDSENFPTRGYLIDPLTLVVRFQRAAGSVIAGPDTESPVPLYFALRNEDPAVDGFFLSQGPEVPSPLPLDVPGLLGQFGANFSVSYENNPLPSLDLYAARGRYEMNGLAVFGLGITDGPFDPIGVIFSSLQIGPTCPADLDDDGVFPSSDPDGGVNISDLLFFLATFEAGAPVADLHDGVSPGMNPDGGVNVDDLLFFLARFEGGC